MSYQHQAQPMRPADNHRGLRLLALTAVVIGLMLLAAAAFVLSYAGIHEVALSAGVSSRWARLYPLMFDAMLVIACAAVLALRGAGVPSRCYAWLSMLVLLAAAAGADTVHATGVTLPRKPTAAAAAIIPWALVLIGFGLLLCMLRQARLRRAAAAAAPDRMFPERSGHVEVRAGAHEARSEGSDPAGPAASPMVSASPAAVAVTASASPAPRPALPSASAALSTTSASPSALSATPPSSPATPAAPPTTSPTTPPTPPGGSPTTPPTPPATFPATSPTAPPAPPATSPTSPVTAPASDASGRDDAAVDPELDLALEAEPGPDDPASDEGSTWSPRPPGEQLAEDDFEPADRRAGDRQESAFSPAPTMPPDVETDASVPEPDEGAFPGLVAKAEPGALPISQLPPHPRLAPEASFEHQPEPAPNPRPAQRTTPQPQPDPRPAPEAALRPEPEAIAQPGSEEAEEDAPTQPQPGPSPDSQPAPPPDPPPAPDADPTRHTPPRPRPAPEAAASLQAAPPPEAEPASDAEGAHPSEPEPGPDAAADSAPTSDADPEAESDVAAPPAAPQFDRMRSSPSPPEA
jgi:Protein of unknown function (DUF2637)